MWAFAHMWINSSAPTMKAVSKIAHSNAKVAILSQSGVLLGISFLFIPKILCRSKARQSHPVGIGKCPFPLR